MNTITLSDLLRDPLGVPVEAEDLPRWIRRRSLHAVLRALAIAHEAWRNAPDDYDDREWDDLMQAIERCRKAVGMPVKEDADGR